MKNQISAKIVTDSINKKGDRITTMEVVMPRFILAEFNTHRLFTRNSASSRAIPFKKMVEMVKNNPFIPIAWQKDHSGMQGTEYFEGWKAKVLELAWRAGAKTAVFAATKLHKLGLTKQLCNRILEPFMYHKVLVTFTETENFFNLRCPQYEMGRKINHQPEEILYFKSKKDYIREWNEGFQNDPRHTSFIENTSELEWLKVNKGMGEIHIMDLAEKMWDAMNESTPVKLKAGEWHIPYGEKLFSNEDFYNFFLNNTDKNWLTAEMHDEALDEMAVKIAIARCARLSYQTLGDNPKIDYEADLKLFNILKDSGHFSPFEHVAKCMSKEEYRNFIKGKVVEDNWKMYDKGAVQLNCSVNHEQQGWCGNFKGFIQYRYTLES